jgi:hypothetical protein
MATDDMFPADKDQRMVFTKAEVIQEMRRELAMRQRVYANQVASGKMNRAEAERRMGIVRSIIDDYQVMAKNGINLDSMR